MVFQGPQAYVSPGWYPSKAEHGKVVPTWNYVMVQARGRLRAVEDAAWLHALVTPPERHPRGDAGRGPGAWPTRRPTTSTRCSRAIVGIEIEMTALTGKWKVSQNRRAADRDGVARGMAQRPGDAAQAMAALVRDAPGP